MPDDWMVRHPHERGGVTSRPVEVCTGCCCLAFLHTAGALAGAWWGGGRKRPPGDPGFDPQYTLPGVHWLFDRWPRTQWIFWTSLPGVIAATIPLCLLAGEFHPLEILAEVVHLFLYLGPAYFPLAWLVGVVRLWLQPAGSVLADEYRALHRALLGSLIGMLLGFLVMFLWLGLLVYVGYIHSDSGQWLGFP